MIAWAAAAVGLPPESSCLLVTGTSIANLIGLLVARRAALRKYLWCYKAFIKRFRQRCRSCRIPPECCHPRLKAMERWKRQ